MTIFTAFFVVVAFVVTPCLGACFSCYFFLLRVLLVGLSLDWVATVFVFLLFSEGVVAFVPLSIHTHTLSAAVMNELWRLLIC